MWDFRPESTGLRHGIAWAGTQFSCFLGAIELAFQVRRERQALLGLNEHMLKDLGLNDAAYAEATRPFWDVPRERLCH